MNRKTNIAKVHNDFGITRYIFEQVHNLIFKLKKESVFVGSSRGCWKNYDVFGVCEKAFRRKRQ